MAVEIDEQSVGKRGEERLTYHFGSQGAGYSLSLLANLTGLRFIVEGGRGVFCSEEACAGADLPAADGPGKLTLIGKNAQGYEEYRHEPTGIVFVRIPPGEFQRGSPPDEVGHGEGEAQRPVRFERPFLFSKTEVTNAQFRRFAAMRRFNKDHSSGEFRGGGLDGDDQPVVRVTGMEMDAFCRVTGLRLPTEEEWERVARGGDGRIFPWGDAWPPPERFERVAPNPFGVQDLGRDWECCGSGCKARLRGGCWCEPRPSLLRCAASQDWAADRPNPVVGFRVALDGRE